MKKSYLPSKEFINRVIILILLVVGIFSVYKIAGFIKNKPQKDASVKLVTAVQKVQNDANDNGIPDWEERLWGLNPNKNGESNKEFILNKRRTLNPNVDLSSYEENLTESDTLAREFFATIMSLQQTGDLDEEAMQAIGKAVSQKVVAEPIPDKYTLEMMRVVSNTPENTARYYKNIQDLISKYQNRDMGKELTFIIQGIAYDDQQVLDIVKTIASAYRDFGGELITIPVPELLSTIHLSMANNYEKNAESIDGLVQVLSDPLVGMKAILSYKKYNDALAIDLNSLSYILN